MPKRATYGAMRCSRVMDARRDIMGDVNYSLPCGVLWPSRDDGFACARFPLESRPCNGAETPAPRRIHILVPGPWRTSPRLSVRYPYCMITSDHIAYYHPL